MRSRIARQLAPAPTVARMITAAVAIAGSAAGATAESDHSFEIYGFAQADFIQDFGGRLDPGPGTVPAPRRLESTVPMALTASRASASSRSRFGVKGQMPTGGDTPISFKFEFDLFGTGADAGQTTFRLRHVWRSGCAACRPDQQPFMDGDVFPNTINFRGPAGMVFYRNVQIRWTPFRSDNSQFAIAIKHPASIRQHPPRRSRSRTPSCRMTKPCPIWPMTQVGTFPGRRNPAQGRLRVP